MTYAYNPTGDWTATHQMTMNGKRDGFTLADFRACAKNAVMKRGRAEAIVEEVRAAAVEVGGLSRNRRNVANNWRKQIRKKSPVGFAEYLVIAVRLASL